MTFVELSSEHYFAHPGLNATRLKAFAKVPALVNAVREETAAMVLGSLVHCAILEPQALEDRYHVTDLDRRGTKDWKAAEAAAEGRELVKATDMQTALFMRDAVWGNATARALLKGCLTEQSVFWSDATTGLECKARADAVNLSLGALVDVKTTIDASPRGFARQFASLGYGLQEIHYRAGFASAGFEPEVFAFITIEKSNPFLVATYELPPDTRQVYDERYAELMMAYAQCCRADHFPGYDDAIVPLDLPFI